MRYYKREIANGVNCPQRCEVKEISLPRQVANDLNKNDYTYYNGFCWEKSPTELVTGTTVHTNT